MEKFGNINDPKIIKRNIISISLFVLLYENVMDVFIERVKKHICGCGTMCEIGRDENGIPKCKEVFDETEYNKIIKERKINGKRNTLLSTMLWFIDEKAITQEDYDTFIQIRNKRNEYVHEMEYQLYNGISISDIQRLASFYQKMNDMWSKKYANEVKVIIMADMIIGNLLKDEEIRNMFQDNA